MNVIEGFKYMCERMGKEYICKFDEEIVPEDFTEYEPDIVISLGGDRTYLRTSAVVTNSEVPVVGVHTYPHLQVGNFCRNMILERHRMK